MEPFHINQLIAKPVPKQRDDVIVKICRKPVMEDDVFDERIFEPEPFLVDKRDQHLVNRAEIMNRLQKIMNGLSVEELKLPEDNEIKNKLSKYFSSSESEQKPEPKPKQQEPEPEPESEKEEEHKTPESEPKTPEQEPKTLEEKEPEPEPKQVDKQPRKRITKKQKAMQEGINENFVVFSNDLYKDITKPKKVIIHKAPTYYMANRRMFIQKLNSLFKIHAEELNKINDADVSCEKRSTEEFETLTHQKVVSDYLNLYSPYRGLLIYHGLGSGKTCTSITLAEGMKSEKKIVVMTPASLKSNFFSELKKCGDEVFRKNQNWVRTKVTNKTDAIKLNKLTGLDVDDIMNKGIWLGTKSADKGKKFADLSAAEQSDVDAQLDRMIRSKYVDINYNGINANIMNKLTDGGTKNPFDNSVVIVDEAHNLVSRIVNKLKQPDSIAYQLYDYLMSAQNAKLVFLSGTPIINYPNEIAILFNMLRGYIKTWTIPVNVRTTAKVNKESLQRLFEREGLNTYDYMEYSGNKLIITRNPFGFINVHNLKSKSDNPMDTYNGITLDETGNISDDKFKNRVVDILNMNDLEVEKSKIKMENVKALPDDTEAFLNMFIDPETGNMNNVDLLKRRVLGLTSYFKSAQEKLLPKYDKNRDFKIIRCEMSDHQLIQYSIARKEERERDKKNKRKARISKDEFDMASTYRIYSRELCNFVFPEEYPRPAKKVKGADAVAGEASLDEMDVDNDNMDEIVESDADYAARIKKALEFLKENADQYLSKEGLLNLSSKFLHILENLEDPDNEGLHLVYSQFRTIEGIGVLKLILEHNGFAEFKLVKKGEDWEILDTDPDMAKPRFVLYTGTESAEEKEIIRNVYNSNWSVLSSSIRSKLEKIATNNFMGEVIKVFMITSSGAEGINLENTRYVHITEPYWHPVRMEQVIGRAKRICSHRNLPEHLRNIQVYLYLSVMTEEQISNERNIELRTRDVSRIDQKTPVTTDEYLYELANTKEQINKQILNAVKETAMDCALYKSDKDLVCYNFGKVSSNEFSTVPILEQDATQNVEMNVKKQTMRGVIMEIMGKKYIAKETNERNVKEIYDIDTKDYIGKAILENKKWRLE